MWRQGNIRAAAAAAVGGRDNRGRPRRSALPLPGAAKDAASAGRGEEDWGAAAGEKPAVVPLL